MEQTWTVIEVQSEPRKENGKWVVDVACHRMGVGNQTNIVFKTKKEALEIKSGYTFKR